MTTRPDRADRLYWRLMLLLAVATAAVCATIGSSDAAGGRAVPGGVTNAAAR